jgi:RNA polymerase sigma-70 factor (ECF subfamily)
MTTTTDEELARQLQQRNPEAMARLYDRFGRAAWSIIVAIVGDERIAEDLIEETFLHVWNRIHAFDPGKGALGPWLLAVARNRAIDHRRPAFELDVREHPSFFVDRQTDVVNTDHARLIRKAVSRLNQQQQKVIELTYYEGLSQSEMAERLGEPLGTVKTWVRTALKNLRDALNQEVAA